MVRYFISGNVTGGLTFEDGPLSFMRARGKSNFERIKDNQAGFSLRVDKKKTYWNKPEYKRIEYTKLELIK